MSEIEILTDALGCGSLNPETNADLGRRDAEIPPLSPQERRKVLLPLATPKPGCRPVISLLHFERKERQGRAYRDDQGRVVFVDDLAAAEAVMSRRQHSPSISDVLATVSSRFLPWRACWRTTKAGIIPWAKDQRSPFGVIERRKV